MDLAGAQGTKEMLPLEKASGLLIKSFLIWMMPLEKASGLLMKSFLIWRMPLEKASGLVGTARPLSHTRG